MSAVASGAARVVGGSIEVKEGAGPDPRAPFLERLGHRAEVIAPSHPGFGHSERPADFETVYDLVHLYLDVLEALPYEKVTLLGLSFGGWLAAEVAVKCGHRLEGLILVDAFGIKVSDRETPDILDALSLYGWHPYMYNPQLPRWLRRITVPTLVLWGASDGIVKPLYGRAYSELIPGSRFELIERAGHHPEIERADAFADAVVGFLDR